MPNSKLTTILASFTPQELGKLRQFAISPLFNNGNRPKRVIDLLEYLTHYHPSFELEALNKPVVYAQVFPEDEEFNKNKLDKLYSETVNLVRKFIITVIELPEQQQDNWLRQIRFFQERKLDSEYKSAVRKLENVLQEVPKDPPYHYYHRFRLEIEKTKFSLRSNDKKSDVNLSAVIQALDLFYCITKMEYCSYYFTQSKHINLRDKKALLLLEEVLETVKENYLAVPVAGTFFHTFPLLNREERGKEKHYTALKKVLEQHAPQISDATFRTLHNIMRNYLAYRYNQGDDDALVNLFELFKDQIQQNSIYQDGHHILASTLQSAITVALKIGEHDWAMDFLLQHQHRINGPDTPSSIFEFNLANIYFYQGHYQKAYDLLPQHHYKEAFYNLAVRRLEVKLHFALSLPLNVIEYRLKAFKSFIHEHKGLLPKDKLDSNKNFVNLLFQIFNIIKRSQQTNFGEAAKIPQAKVEKLIAKLNAEKVIAERDWLKDILQQLRED